MAKLRKMLGDLQDPSVIALMALIETQSKKTLAAWAIQEVSENYLPIFKEHTSCFDFDVLINQCFDYLNHKMTLKEVKPVLNQARALARLQTHDPIAEAVAKAIATAMAVITTPTNALGFTFYGAAVHAYSTAGLNADKDVYDKFAKEELARLYHSLKNAALIDETDPVSVKWHC